MKESIMTRTDNVCNTQKNLSGEIERNDVN